MPWTRDQAGALVLKITELDKEELRILEKALQAFSQALRHTHYIDPYALEKEAIYVTEPDKAEEAFNQTYQLVETMQGKSQELERRAEELLTKLASARSTTRAELYKKLTDDEVRSLSILRSIKTHLRSILDKLLELKQAEWNQVLLQDKNIINLPLTVQLRKLIGASHLELSGLRTELTVAYELEQEIQKLLPTQIQEQVIGEVRGYREV